MITKVQYVSLMVKDQEEALRWYREKLGFEVREDNPFPGGSGRWLTIAPKGQQEMAIILQPPQWGLGGDPESRAKLVGQVPGWVLITDNCRRDYQELTGRGVRFISAPEELPWGVSAVFEDLYGTQHNLVQSR